MHQQIVFVCSPFRGDTERNIAYARAAMKQCIEFGEVPLVPHLLYTQVLDDNKPEQRRQGINLGKQCMFCCDLVVVYWDHGISEGMQHEIDLATQLAIKIEYRKLDASVAA